MKKILVVFGTRPEAIKLSPLILKLLLEKNFSTKVCVTGQHREMLDQVLNSFKITPDYDLSIMEQNQTLSHITERVLRGVSNIIDDFSPDILIVHGDTSTTFAASLAAFYKGIPVAHVEAGLRSGNTLSPYPEEFNRRAVSLMADLHFAPTENAAQNLIREGITQSKVFITGNTVIDAVLLNSDSVPSFDAPPTQFAIMTVHRREHSEEDIMSIFRAVRRLCTEEPDISVIFPVHKSPRMLRLSSQILGDVKNVKLTEPLAVRDFHHLLKKCRFVLTDSGGIQEEASFLGKPVLVVRENTERPEGTLCGTLKVIGSKENDVYHNMRSMFFDNDIYKKSAVRCDCFGNGHASERIIEILRKI